MTYRVRNPDLHQEEDVVPVWQVVAGFVTALVISMGMIFWAVLANRAAELTLRPGGAFPDRWLGPRHEVSHVREDLFGEQRGASVIGRQRAVLSSYGWVDRERGLVRIPIEKAIDMVIEGRGP